MRRFGLVPASSSSTPHSFIRGPSSSMTSRRGLPNASAPTVSRSWSRPSGPTSRRAEQALLRVQGSAYDWPVMTVRSGRALLAPTLSAVLLLGCQAAPPASGAAVPETPTTASADAYSALVSAANPLAAEARSEEHTSELQSLMRISYAVFCLKKKNQIQKRQYV